MNLLSRIFALAAENPMRIVLPEGGDPRVLDAAVEAERRGFARITVLGKATVLRKEFALRGMEDSRIRIIDPERSSFLERYASEYRAIRPSVGMDFALSKVRDPIGFAAMMVRTGDADGTLAGAAETSALTIRTALRIIGKSPAASLVSSFFLMIPALPHHPSVPGIIFADCGLVVDPDARELAEIALSSAQSAKLLLGSKPAVAFLSYSTQGSASHPLVTKVRNAVAIAREQNPDLIIEGEMQFDAAIEPSIRAIKSPNSWLKSVPSVLVFPNLEAGNIGYKIAERIGGMTAIGPVMQGLAKPANDLSRGCKAADILALIAITAIQAQNISERTEIPEFSE